MCPHETPAASAMLSAAADVYETLNQYRGGPDAGRSPRPPTRPARHIAATLVACPRADPSIFLHRMPALRLLMVSGSNGRAVAVS